MTRPAAPTLSTVLVAATAVGALLLTPGRAAAGSGERVGTAAPASPRIGPGELRRLLDQVVAAGAPGVAARVVDEHGVSQAASTVRDLVVGSGLTSETGAAARSRAWRASGNCTRPSEDPAIVSRRAVYALDALEFPVATLVAGKRRERALGLLPRC
jgi:hypothetical protein